MEIHFEVVDPLDRFIHCTKDRWFNHILNNRLWLEDANWEEEIVKALENPLIICPDNHYEKRECYYYHPGVNAYYLKVVVDITADDVGYVVTAYEVNKPEEEKIKWSPILSH